MPFADPSPPPKKSPHQNLSPQKNHNKVSNTKQGLGSLISKPSEVFAPPYYYYARVLPPRATALTSWLWDARTG